MSKKSRLLLGLACVSMILTMIRFVPDLPVGIDISDFAAGLSVALLISVLVKWKDQPATKAH